MFTAKTRGRDVEWGRRAVLVDPEERLLGEVARELGRKGMEVRSCADEAAALAEIESLEPPVLIVGDVPGELAGAEFCWQVHERFPFIQFVLLSSEPNVDVSMPPGAHVLCRPPRGGVLFAAVRAAITQNDLQLDNDRLRDLVNRQGLELNQTRHDIRKEIARRRDAIVASKDRWEAAFDALVHPFAIVTSGGTIEAANRAYAQIAEQESSALVGAVCHEVLFRRSTPCQGCPLASGQAPVEQPFEVRGRDRDEAFMATVQSFAQGEWLCQYREVSTERSQKERAQHLAIMSAVGQLSAGVAHELNNPLGAILALVQVMLRDAKLGSEELEDLQVIESAAERCRRIVAALLRFARGKTHGPPENFAVEPVVQDAIIVCRGELKAASAVEEVEIEPELPMLRGSPVGLQRALVALISNACDALRSQQTDALGVITVRVFCRREEVWIEVADNGPGLPEHMLDDAFTPLVSGNDNASGAGFGLADVYKIVESFGGAVALLSGPEGGATARMMLPKAAPATPTGEA